MQALAAALDQQLALHPQVSWAPRVAGAEAHRWQLACSDASLCASPVQDRARAVSSQRHCPLLHRLPQLEARIRAYFGANTTPAHLKMAETPTGARRGLAGRLWPAAG